MNIGIVEWTRNIINGWGNYISNDEEANHLAKYRSSYCHICPEKRYEKLLDKLPDEYIPEIKSYKCVKCGCPLSSKLRSIREVCPLGKW